MLPEDLYLLEAALYHWIHRQRNIVSTPAVYTNPLGVRLLLAFDLDGVLHVPHGSSPLLESAELQTRKAIRAIEARDSADAEAFLGMLLFSQGKFAECATAWEHCIQEPGVISAGGKFLGVAPTEDGHRSYWEASLCRLISHAWEKAGNLGRALDHAIRAAELQHQKGDFLRIANLFVKKDLDYARAYQYLQRELEIAPELGEDTALGTALAVSGAVGLPYWEDYAERWLKRDWVERDLSVIRRTLRSMWPPFSKLHEHTQQFLAEGTYYLTTSDARIPESDRFGIAIKKIYSAAHKELRARVFLPFRELTLKDPELVKHVGDLRDSRLQHMRRFLEDGRLTLGGGFLLLAIEPSEKVMRAFREFLDARFTRRIRDARYDWIRRLRILDAHSLDEGTPLVFTGADAHEALEVCRQFLEDLTKPPDPAAPSKGPGKPFPSR